MILSEYIFSLSGSLKKSNVIEVITMDSWVYKDLVGKIDKISAFVVKCKAGIRPQNNDEMI